MADNSHVPEIQLSYDDAEARMIITKVAAALDSQHFGEGGHVLRSMMTAADINLGRATNKAANETVKEVADLMRMRQYHGKSGYGPNSKAFRRKANNQHMVERLKDHVNGQEHRIYTDISNNGYNYSQAFEYGLLSKNYPAHHPFEDAANHLGLSHVNGGNFENYADEAIKKGFS